MALVNSFEIINLLSKNELGLINGGKFDATETNTLSKISIDTDYDFSEKLEQVETCLTA